MTPKNSSFGRRFGQLAVVDRGSTPFLFLSLQNVSPWGGSEELWAGAAQHLLARGLQVSACVYDWLEPAQRVRELAARGATVGTFSLRPTIRDRLCGKLGCAPTDRFAWLDRNRPSLVVISGVGHTAFGRELDACRTRDLPYILVVQAASEPIWPSGAELERLIEVYRKAIAVCFVSESNRRLVERQFGLPLPNARVVRNPFNVRYDAVSPWPDEGQGLKLACVGRLDPCHKGQDLIIEVLGRPKWRERPLSVSLVGRGASEDGLRRLCGWRKARVTFRPFTNDIEQVWAEHHGLILPSRVEGLPLALVEAQLCGRMAVVTDVAGNAEVVTDGETGFVAPAPTPDLLDAALERAWARRSEWRALGAAAARRVRELVPADPAAEFADYIESLTRSPQQPQS